MRRRYTGRVGTVLKYIFFALSCLPDFFRRYDVVHVHYFVPLAVLGSAYRALHRGSRLVVTFHGGDAKSRNFRGLSGSFWHGASRYVDLGIAVGPGIAESVDKYLSVRSVKVLPAGVDSRKFYPPDNAFQEKNYDFVFAGSFFEGKGVDLLVDALMDNRLAAARAGFVGTGPLRRHIESLDKCRDIVIFDHLAQDALREVFWESRFLVLPSRVEAFGLVVSEAIFCGVPAIVSDVPGPASQVQDKKNGFVFECGSVESLARTLVMALELGDSQYADMAAKARSSNREFDIIEVTRDLVGAYRLLFDSRGAANR